MMVIHARDSKEKGKSTALGKWAWWISFFSLLIPYIAPISLVLAGVDLSKAGESNNYMSHLKRPSKLALLNSTWALITVIAIFGIFVFRWTE